jgi:serine/threonine protein kinase
MEASLLLGEELAGRYRLLRHLGDGPVGSSFEAATTDAPVLAVKVIERSLLSEDALSRYLQSASTATAVRNAHLVATRDVAYDLPRGFVVFVRDLLPAPDLGSLLAKNGPVTPPNAVRIVAQACEGVARLHASDLVHRNLKPSNVFLDADVAGVLTVRVCDPAVGRGMTARSKVATWQHLRFASPEQAGAAGASNQIDSRTDVYSLGAVLHALLTGAPPYAEIASVESLAEALSSR